MTIGQLRALIAGLPDDMRLVEDAPDHSYREITLVEGTALYDKRAGWTEDYGEETTPEKEYGKRLRVLIAS